MESVKISIKRVIGSVIGNLRLKNINSEIDDFARWAIEAENFIGTSNSYVHKECLIQFKDMKACIPDDVIYIEGLKYGEYYMDLSKKDFTMWSKGASNGGSISLASIPTAKLNTGIMNQANGNIGMNDARYYDFNPTSLVFSMRNRYIYVNSKEVNEIGISYEGVALDEEGWPLIAQEHEVAVQAYLMWQYKTADFVNGKTPHHVYKELERRWYDLCAQARGNDELPNSDEMQYLSNMWNQLIPLPNKNFF